MRMSLRYKFILAFVAFTVAVSTAFGVIVAQHLGELLRGEYERQAVELAEHAAEEVLESQIFGTGHDPSLLVRNLLVGDVVYAQVVLNGEVLAEQARISVRLSTLTRPEGVRISEVRPPSDPRYLDVVYPIRDALGVLMEFGHLITPEGQRLLEQGLEGYVRLGISLRRMEREILRESFLLAAISLGMMSFGILIGWGLYRMILGPIEHLSAAMREFAAGNFRARAEIRSGDEIEALAHEFNSMAYAIVHQRDALRRTNEELQRANRVKAAFLAAMSHELLTPLHSILGYTSLLLDGVHVELSEAGRRYARAIQRAGKHLLALIENVLQFSKLEAGAERLRLTLVPAADIVQEVVESQRPLADGKGLVVETEVEPGLTLWTDSTKLKQVLLNLVNNAIKYTEEGRVCVRAFTRDGSVRFEVEDTGRGIDPRVRTKLFEPFARIEETEGRPNGGVGLGLVVARRYAQMLGGSLSYESTVGKGSRFWVELPKGGPNREP